MFDEEEERAINELTATYGALTQLAIRKDIFDLAGLREPLQSAIEICEDQNDRRMVLLMDLLATLERVHGGLSDARRLYLRLEEIHRKDQNARSEGVVLHNLAIVERAMVNFDEAKRLLRKAMVIAERLDAHARQGELRNELAYTLFLQGDPSEVERLADRARAIAEKFGNKHLKSQAILMWVIGIASRDRREPKPITGIPIVDRLLMWLKRGASRGMANRAPDIGIPIVDRALNPRLSFSEIADKVGRELAPRKT